jgi:hypothetical protein
MAVRPEHVEGRNGGFIAFMLRQAQDERGVFRFDTYHCILSSRRVFVQENLFEKAF